VSDTSDKFNRSVALDKALGFWGPGAAQNPALVLETAEKFRAFLAGDDAKPQKYTITVDERPAFRLPRSGDGYLYFRFRDSYILYRSHTGNGAFAKSVDRISAIHEVDWERATGSLTTRQGLREADGYEVVNPGEAASIIRKHMKGVRFE
jgi:hypothetical protein